MANDKDVADIFSCHNEAGRKAIREILELKAVFLKEILTPFFNETTKDENILDHFRTCVLAS